MKVSTLYKINNDVVFYKVGNNKNRNIVNTGIINGTLTGFDVNGNPMTKEDASRDWLIMCDYNHIPTNRIEAVARNVSLYTVIVSIVRAMLFDAPNGVANLSALSPMILAIQVGLFKDAADMLQNMERTEIFTDALLSTWEGMLRAANAADSVE